MRGERKGLMARPAMRKHPTVMPRAYLFDLDGTLVDTERENTQSIIDVLAARGRQLSDEEKRFVVGHGWREIYALLAAGGGLDLSFDELKEAAAAAKERLCDRDGLRQLPGAVAFVRRAAERGPCAVVSGSTRREIAWCLERLGLDGVMRFYVGAEDVARGKPEPDGYLAASTRLVVSPADCTVFEDSTFGIAAARAAGMRCVALAVGNYSGQDQSGADVRVESFEALDDRLWEP